MSIAERLAATHQRAHALRKALQDITKQGQQLNQQAEACGQELNRLNVEIELLSAIVADEKASDG